MKRENQVTKKYCEKTENKQMNEKHQETRSTPLLSTLPHSIRTCTFSTTKRHTQWERTVRRKETEVCAEKRVKLCHEAMKQTYKQTQEKRLSAQEILLSMETSAI